MAGNRGGKREGSGRKAGSTTSRATILTRRKAATIIESDLSPLDVMMSNLQFWNKEIAKLENVIRKDVPKGQSILQVERTPIVESYFNAREHLQEAAVKAAPYVHPRIAPVESNGDGQRDLSRLTDDELYTLERITRKITVSYENPSGNAASVCEIQGEKSH
jgi:hypothetical protein